MTYTMRITTLARFRAWLATQIPATPKDARPGAPLPIVGLSGDSTIPVVIDLSLIDGTTDPA